LASKAETFIKKVIIIIYNPNSGNTYGGGYFNSTELKMIPVKLSWKSLKVSIAGAKLSHLVQEEQIWDHGKTNFKIQL
jgi:hypothetical protein